MSNIVKYPSSQQWPQQNWSQGWPPTCSCGCNPCQCGGGWGGLMQCWQDIAQFQQFLICMLSQAGPFPMQGVTDGSNAKAGNIGEFITGTGSATYAAAALSNVAISPLVVAPGDWDLRGFVAQSGPVTGISLILTPAPAGMSNQMEAAIGSVDTGATVNNFENVPMQMARGSFTVPTLLSWAGQINTTTGQAAGTVTLYVEGRRMR
jgi:hypothetical protein